MEWYYKENLGTELYNGTIVSARRSFCCELKTEGEHSGKKKNHKCLFMAVLKSPFIHKSDLRFVFK